MAFDGVWFTYQGRAGEGRATTPGDLDGADYVLKDVSFEVRPGERVGIVGATGSGKTTLINLLLRFYDVTRGRITVDGVDIRDLDLADLRGLFSLVLQDVHLFSGTIADNIRLGNDAIDDEPRAPRGRAPCTPTRSSSGCRTDMPALSPSVARRLSVGPEAAAVLRARAGVRSAGADSRRGDVERRHGNGAVDP